MTFGKRLKVCIARTGVTQKVFARDFGISYSTLSGYTTDARQPDLDTLTKLAKALNTSLEYLITGEETNSSKINEILELLRDEPKLQSVFDHLVQLDMADLKLASEQLDSLLEVIIRQKK